MMLGSKLRIGMLAPVSWRVPPRHYGPWEQVVSDLTEGLVAAGVDVTLFATADSLTGARLEAVIEKPYSEDPECDAKVATALHIAHAFERAGEFDLIHNHFDFLPLTYSALVSTPVVTTIHGFSSLRIVPVYARYNAHGYYVSISDADRAPDLDYIATIHHGIRMENFSFSPAPDDYLLFFGRIHPDKGCADAIAVARALKRPLRIAGIIQDEAYFRTEVQPYLSDTITYLGPVGPDKRAQLLGGAAALLHLIHFDEPFGLSVVESMACGTPVVAYPRGSMPELIRPGENGVFCSSIEEAVEALDVAEKLDRRKVRNSVLRRFSVERMVTDYLAVYEQICSAGVSSPRLGSSLF